MIKYLFVILLLSNTAMAEEMTIGLSSLTYHGTPVSKQYMDKPISDDGRLIYNPQISITRTNDTEDVYNVSYLKDSFGNNAGYLGVGKVLGHPIENQNVGFMLGLYVRERPPIQDMMGAWMIGNYDVIIFPFAYLEQVFPVNKDWGVSLMLNTNIIITQASIGLKFNL